MLTSWQCNIRYAFISEIKCRAVPVWLGFRTNTNVRRYSTELNYTGAEGMEFEDDDMWKLSTCNISGYWSPGLQNCKGTQCNYFIHIVYIIYMQTWQIYQENHVVNVITLVMYNNMAGYIFASINSHNIF